MKIEVEGSCKSFYKPIQSLIFNFILVLDQKQPGGHSGMELACKNVKIQLIINTKVYRMAL
jgi:hypothetical protein